MVFEKYSKILTRDFATLDEDTEQNKMAKQKVEVFLDGIKTANTKLIDCKAIISYNCASNFTGACSHFSDQAARFHVDAHLEAQRYKLFISQVSRIGGGRDVVQVHSLWMCGGHYGAVRGGKYGIGGNRGGRSQTMINSVDVSYPNSNFTANEWNSLGWNGGWVYVSQVRDNMNGRGSRGLGGGHGGGR